MAKKIFEGDRVTGYEPGVIYALVYNDTPFYVGETTDKDRRLAEHIYGGSVATDESETKYQFIKHLDSMGIPWDMEILAEYSSEGPEALEDEHMMALLVDGYTLTNEKKGNANWMTERVAVADDMRERGIRSFSEYKKAMADEEALHSDRRTPEQIARLAKVMEGILGSAEESYQYALKVEKRTARRRKQQLEREQDQFVERLQGIAEETFKLAEGFPIEEQIALLQGSMLTWDKYGCSNEVRQITATRLAELQELAK